MNTVAYLDPREKLRALIVEHITGWGDDIQTAADDKLLTDLGADSLDLVEITMALEEELDIEIRDADFNALGPRAAITVGAVIDLALKIKGAP